MLQCTIWLYDPYGEYGNMLFFEGVLNHPIETREVENQKRLGKVSNTLSRFCINVNSNHYDITAVFE